MNSFSTKNISKRILKRMQENKKLTKSELSYEIGRYKPLSAYHLYYDNIKRDDMVKYFNNLFNTKIK